MTPEQIDDVLTKMIEERPPRDKSAQQVQAETLRAKAEQLQLEAKHLNEKARGMLREARDLGSAPSRERPDELIRAQLMLRLHRIDGLTLQRTGEIFGISRERVRQIILNAERRAVANARRVAGVKQAKDLYDTDVDKEPLNTFDLSVRALNCLENAEIYTVGQLRERIENNGWHSLLKIKNFGHTSFAELRKAFTFILDNGGGQ
jgi:hypothetical protein